MAKENSTKMEREPTVWENIFANNNSENGLSPKYTRNSHDCTPDDKQPN